MNGFEIRLQPVVSLPIVVLVAAILLGLLLVRPRHVQLRRWQWVALVGLRLAVVLLMFVALLRPSLIYTKVEPVPASIVMLVDTSRSMQVADSLGDKPRWEAVKRLLRSAADDLAKISKRVDIAAYTFDRDSRKLPIKDGKISLASAADGDESAIGTAMSAALDQEANRRVLATLLLSDGAQRALAPRDLPPQVAARRLVAENIPLYTFTFGKPGGRERADLALDDLVTNETIFTEMPTEVRAQLTASGYANQIVKVQLLWESKDGMEVVDTAEVDTGTEGGAAPVALHYTPRTPGEYKATLRVEAREGELITTNNEASTFVTVRPGGINVLYLVGAKRVGGGPGPEQRFVRAALARSPDIVVERRLINYDPPEIDLADEIERTDSAPDVVILDDVDLQGLSYRSWQAIAERVRDGTGLMMLGGYHSFGPGGFRNSPLADVLPIHIGPAERQVFGQPLREDVQLRGPLKMRPAAPLGVRHPIMQLSVAAGGSPADAPIGEPSVATVNIWEQLPPLDGANRIARSELKPNAQVLAEVDDGERHPLLVAGQSGDGRVLAFASDSTWHWQMGGFGHAHQRFWRQCVLWLAKKDEQTEGRVWIRLAGRRVARGGRVEFKLGAEDAQGRPLEAAEFDVAVQTPSGQTEQVRPTRSAVSPKLQSESRRDSPTWSATFRKTANPGDYRVVVKARSGSEEVGTAEARFLVPDQDLELDRPAAEPGLMAQLAAMTKSAGGTALAPEELPDLLKRLAEKPPEMKQEVIAKVTYWDTWPFFLVFVGLLSTEWFLRKRWGLV
jgi:hypothetical protein